jgi:hypothetical protein
VANPKSRREFLTGTGAALAVPRGAVASLIADAALLAELSPWQREIVQQAMNNHPRATLAETISVLRAFGM